MGFEQFEDRTNPGFVQMRVKCVTNVGSPKYETPCETVSFFNIGNYDGLNRMLNGATMQQFEAKFSPLILHTQTQIQIHK